MKETVKKLWVEKLRDPETKQAFGRLRDGDCFCVLGVLCELAVENGIAKREDYSEEGHGWVYEDKTGMSANLPTDAIVDWAGLDFQRMQLNYEGSINAITYLNDVEQLSFPHFADLIEQQL